MCGPGFDSLWMILLMIVILYGMDKNRGHTSDDNEIIEGLLHSGLTPLEEDKYQNCECTQGMTDGRLVETCCGELIDCGILATEDTHGIRGIELRPSKPDVMRDSTSTPAGHMTIVHASSLIRTFCQFSLEIDKLIENGELKEGDVDVAVYWGTPSYITTKPDDRPVMTTFFYLGKKNKNIPESIKIHQTQ